MQGRSLGQAATLARKGLADDPLRTIAYDPVRLQDWPVPVVFESFPIRLFPAKADRPKLRLQVSNSRAAEAGALDAGLPKPPDVGFFGRDETLLELDRSFDLHPVVLLHAFAGSGKTQAAAEFARWYALTGGVEGPVLFTSFETYRPLPRVLDRIGEVFGAELEQSGIHWLALDDDQRRDLALQVMQQVPVLWIWDNVEPIMGMRIAESEFRNESGAPDSQDSNLQSQISNPQSDTVYTADERRALADFLRDAAQTKAKFLLTSRRDERSWVGDLPRRTKVGPMPMHERVQLARALAEKHGRQLTDVADWRPLLRFTEGNPLTLTVVVGQAMRDGLRWPYRQSRAQSPRPAVSIRLAVPHFRESIRLMESSGNLYHAGGTRYNVALTLAQAGKLQDAREYARAALRNLQPYGPGAADMTARAQQLLVRIEQDLAAGSG